MKARFTKVIGHRAYLHVEGHKHIKDFPIDSDSDQAFGHELICQTCGQTFTPKVFGARYDTASGDLEPGCLFWNNYYPKTTYWDNQEGPHLVAVLPNGTHWQIDGRASNCTMPHDRTHRCWVRHGDPETGIVHVDKNGHTCNAGAGSIHVDQGTPTEWHGFLHDGEFNKC